MKGYLINTLHAFSFLLSYIFRILSHFSSLFLPPRMNGCFVMLAHAKGLLFLIAGFVMESFLDATVTEIRLEIATKCDQKNRQHRVRMDKHQLPYW